jgi:hypothetical protein
VQRFADDTQPPYRVGYRRGDETAEEEFDGVRTEFGNGRVELIYPDGRHVTVDVAELERMEATDAN